MNSRAIVNSLLQAFMDGRREWRCAHLPTDVRVSSRQERIAGWEQSRLSAARVVLLGAGGMGGELAEGMAQKGVGTVFVADGDFVTPTNLNRQKFQPQDLWRNKAVRLCARIAGRGFLGTRLVAYPGMFQELEPATLEADLIIAAVDNQIPTTRFEVSRSARLRGVPAIIMGATPDADGGYVFVQGPAGPCWACAQKPELQTAAARLARCPESPASIDILKTLAGIALYAADSILMRRPREWNLWTVSLRRIEFGGPVLIQPRPGCPICGGRSDS